MAKDKDSEKKKAKKGGGLIVPILLLIAIVYALVMRVANHEEGTPAKAAQGESSPTIPRDNSTKPQPIPAPKTVSVTSTGWSEEVSTQKYPDAFVLHGLKPADVTVRVWSGKSYKDLPMGKTSGNVYDKVQFKSRASKGRIEVHLFRSVEQKQRWLSEP